MIKAVRRWLGMRRRLSITERLNVVRAAESFYGIDLSDPHFIEIGPDHCGPFLDWLQTRVDECRFTQPKEA